MSTPAIVINGTSGAYEQPQRFGWDTSGPFIIRTWKGTPTEIATQHNANLAAGIYSEVTGGFGTNTCVARYSVQTVGGSGEVPVDAWEFFASHAEKDVLEADNATINAMPDDDKKQIRHLLANPPATSADVPAWVDATNSPIVYSLMESGMRAIRVNAPMLRHTQTVSNVWTVKAALTNVGRIISSATLATTESIPSSVLFNMPADVSLRDNLAYGWMKMHPTIRCAARQKMQIEQEWEYGLWPPLIYLAVL